MDNHLEREIRELNAERDSQLCADLSIPERRREALCATVSRLQEEQSSGSTSCRYLLELFAAIQGRATAWVAAACAVLVATTYLSLHRFGASERHRTSAVDVSSAHPLVPARAEQSSSLTLRVGAAQLTQLQSSLLAQHRAFATVALEDIPLAGLDLTRGIRLDGGFELTP